MYANDRMEIVGREIYTAFQWAGDVGGLFQALEIMFLLLIGSFARTNMNSFLGRNLYQVAKGYLRQNVDST